MLSVEIRYLPAFKGCLVAINLERLLHLVGTPTDGNSGNLAEGSRLRGGFVKLPLDRDTRPLCNAD